MRPRVGLTCGFPAFIAFLSVHDWPAREPCPNCRRPRVVNRDQCEHCGAAFPPPERTGIEKGNPRDNFFVSGNYSLGALSLTARTQRYGAVSFASGNATSNTTGALYQTFGAKWVTDLGLSFTLRSKYTLSIGADNVFDVYPDRNINPGDPATANGGISNFGIFPYNGITPFGSNGRFLYTKLTLGL